MNKKSKSTKQNKNLLSVRELKTWLDGYCSAHGNEWSPTADQWNIIKNKIFSLEEALPVQQVAQFPPQYAPNPPQHQPPQVPQSNLVTRTSQVPLPPQYSADASALSQSVIGATDRPAMILSEGRLKTPNKEADNGPSDFA